MLPSLVIKIEKHRSLQQKRGEIFLPRPFFLTEFLSERKFFGRQTTKFPTPCRTRIPPAELAKYGPLMRENEAL
jgi:hypothetical protein